MLKSGIAESYDHFRFIIFLSHKTSRNTHCKKRICGGIGNGRGWPGLVKDQEYLSLSSPSSPIFLSHSGRLLIRRMHFRQFFKSVFTLRDFIQDSPFRLTERWIKFQPSLLFTFLNALYICNKRFLGREIYYPNFKMSGIREWVAFS